MNRSVSTRWALLTIVLIPLFANILPLLGIVNADTQLLYSGLQYDIVHGFAGGLPYIDPSVGFTYEPEAREALRQWLSGSFPWWNHYEGIGVPLAGGLVPGAFSPFLPFLLLPHGLLVQQIVNQIVCGLLTFALLRMLKCPIVPSLIAGALFELNGTFAWLGFLWCHPVIGLPLSIVGLELVRRWNRRDVVLGMLCLAFAVYLAIVGSFIEIGYLDSLLAVGWFVVRASQFPLRKAGRYLAVCAGGAVTGFGLAAPQLVALIDEAKTGTSVHSVAAIGFNSLASAAQPQFVMPYIWGSIFGNPVGDIGSVWSNVGGYMGLAPILVASAVLCSRKERRLEFMLCAWIVLTVGAQFGVPWLVRLINFIPGISYTAQYRYSPASWEFAVAVLCGLVLAQWTAERKPFLESTHRITLAVLGVIFAGGLVDHEAQFALSLTAPGYDRWLAGSVIVAIAVFAAVLGLMILRSHTRAVALLGLVLVGEAFLFYFIPSLSYPRGGKVDLTMARFVQSHTGQSRLYSMGWLAPDYGSMYGIPMLNNDDPLIPTAWTSYAMNALDPYSISPLLLLQYRIGDHPPLGDTYAWERKNFDGLGAKFLTAPPEMALAPYLPATGGSQTSANLASSDIAGTLSGIDGANISAVGVLLGTYGATAAGAVDLKVCSGSVCRSASVQLADVPDNSFANFALSSPLPISERKIRFTIAQRSHAKPAAVWLYARGNQNEALTIGAKDHFPRLQIFTELTTFSTPTENTGNVAYPLAERRIHVVVAAPPLATSITSVAVFQGTSGDTADGYLRIRVCSGSICAAGRTPLRGTTDNGYTTVPLEHALRLTSATLQVDLMQERGRIPDSIWLFPQAGAFPQTVTYGGNVVPNMAAKLQFIAVAPQPRQVYNDSIIRVYEVTTAKPYEEAAGCRVYTMSWDEAQTDCPRPSALVRRELFYPGWSATINGSRLEPTASDLFQKVPLPAGHATIEFSFRPEHAEVAVVIWIVSMLLFIGGGFIAIKEHSRLAQPRT